MVHRILRTSQLTSWLYVRMYIIVVLAGTWVSQLKPTYLLQPATSNPGSTAMAKAPAQEDRSLCRCGKVSWQTGKRSASYSRVALLLGGFIPLIWVTRSK